MWTQATSTSSFCFLDCATSLSAACRGGEDALRAQEDTAEMDRVLALAVTFSVLQESQAFNVESRAWKTLSSSESPDGWFGYKVMKEDESRLLVSDPLLQTSPTKRGKIYSCSDDRCRPVDLQVPEFAVNMSLGLTMAGDPASRKTMACGPTITRECKNINTYSGMCLQIYPKNKLITPSTLKDCPGISDIAFLLDGSGSVSTPDFEVMRRFVKNLISSLRGAETQFAITEYSDNPRTHYYFNTFGRSGQWENEIDSIAQTQGWTYTAAAIRNVVTNVFSTARGSRTNSKKVLIVITDGASNDRSQLNAAVYGAETQGIIRFAIGVGNAVPEELNTIGSTPTKSHVFHVTNFAALDRIRAELEESIFSIEGTQTGGSFKMEMAQEGFSAAYLPKGGFQMGSVGAYEWSGGFQRYSSNGQQTYSQDKELVEANSYLGYSMTVANTRAGPVTIVGAPRYHHRGVVFVYHLDISTNQRVDPDPWQRSQIGEYFGAEVAAMALDPNAKYPKVVLIAAPLHTAGDSEGRVYVCKFLAGVDCQFDNPVILQGRAGERGRFGSSISPLPDLNQDGVNDLAVGAPLENQGQGSVYIFHGDARDTINTKISQRIAGSGVQTGLRFFGLSISQSSFHTLPGLAVGSKGKVLLLRSRPIVMVQAEVSFTPAQIPPSSSECNDPVPIKANVCFTRSGQPSAQTATARINFTLSLDTARKRAYFPPKGQEQSHTFTLSKQRECFLYDFSVEPCPDDSLNDLFNELTFSFEGLPSTDNLRPSLAEKAQTTTYHPLGFKINCENACEDQLQVGFNFSGSSYVRVGIDDLLNVTTSLTNLGEDSYYSQVLLTYPAELSFRRFTALQGRVDCSSLDSENGISLGRTTCLIYRPIFKSKAKAVFTVSYGVEPNSQLKRQILITANATSGNLDHAGQSVLYQRKEIDVKYSVFLSIASSLGYTNFTYGRSDLHKPVVKPVKVLNFVRAFNVTVVIKVPVKLGGQYIWQEQENLQIPECQRFGEEQPARSDFVTEIQQNLTVDCSVASCLVFRCNLFMRRQQTSIFTIAANLSSGWIEQIGLTSAKFLLESTATVEYDEDTYIFYSTESKNTPPIRKIVTEVEVYPVANFTKEIVGGTIGGLLLLALIAAALYKAGFFKSRYKQMIKDAGGADGGADGGGDGGEGGEQVGQAPSAEI